MSAPVVGRVLKLANEVHGLARTAGRDDVREPLADRAARWGDTVATVVLAGAQKRGKSRLLNALVGRPDLLPVDADIATNAQITVRHGETLRVTVHRSVTSPDGSARQIETGIDPGELAAYAQIDNAQAAARRAVDPDTMPEAQRPGRHTVVLNVASSLSRTSRKTYSPTCRTLPTSTPATDLTVGWGQVESNGDPCVSEVAETAVRFDEGPLDQVPMKTIDRAVLTYGEAAAQYCIYPPGTGTTCWRSGSGAPEFKPNGCVAVLGYPTVDWVNAAPAGLIPHTTVAQATRNNPREWDVSTPYRWQYERSAPLGGATPPPFGFLLSGGVGLDRLDAEDNTNCVSSLSNVQLRVTYTVPPSSGGGFVPPR